MKNLGLILLTVFAAAILSGCGGGETNSQPTRAVSSSPQASKPPTSSSSSSSGLTNANVETAVASLLDEFRIGGSIRVSGIQEQPAQNAAVADLRFDGFEYTTGFQGNLLKKKDFKPKAMPQNKTRIPSPEEMFPPKKVVYSRDGKAILARYTDGRWVLKEVRWDFDKGVKGSVDVR